MSRPRVLVTLDLGEIDRRGVRFPIVQLKCAYADAVERAGGLPLLVPPTADPEALADLAALMDGLVVTGGAFDIDPSHYGQQARGRIDAIKPTRTNFERALLERALADGRPVLGICGGMQLLNVVLGGTLIQDIGTEVAGALVHEQPTSPAGPHHVVAMTPRGAWANVLAAGELGVNSTHHQAVDRLGSGLYDMGRSPDGVIEAIARDDLRVAGVQWHPELLDDAFSRTLYANLVAQSRR